jgi:hypothetical protein
MAHPAEEKEHRTDSNVQAVKTGSDEEDRTVKATNPGKFDSVGVLVPLAA